MESLGKTKDALICGGGIGGLATALTLSKRGIKATVFERAETFAELGAGLQLSPNATHVLNALGLHELIKSKAFQSENSTIRDYKFGNTLLNVPLKNTCEPRYGAPYYHIHRADLHGLLLDEAVKSGVTILQGQSAIGYTQTPEKAHLQTNKGVYSADILIGADGLRSTIKDIMLGPEPPAFTGQVAWRGTVSTTDEIKKRIPPDVTIWVGPHHHFVTYYIKSGTLLNFVAVQERSDWTSTDWTEPGDVSQLKAAFKDWHADIQMLLGATQDCFLWALFAREPLPSWGDRRVALLGDAAHPMLPFMAQGAAMAIEDAWVLAKMLSKHPVSQALAQYEAVRKPRTSMVQQTSLANAKLFHRRSGAADLWQQAKLRIGGLVPRAALYQLDKIYAVNVTRGEPNAER